MSKMADNLERLAAAIEQDRGELDLLPIFWPAERDGADLVFSAPWAVNRVGDSIGYVGRKAAEILSKEEAAIIKSTLVLNQAVAGLADRFGGPGEVGSFQLHQGFITRAIFARLRTPAAQETPDVAPVTPIA